MLLDCQQELRPVGRSRLKTISEVVNLVNKEKTRIKKRAEQVLDVRTDDEGNNNAETPRVPGVSVLLGEDEGVTTAKRQRKNAITPSKPCASTNSPPSASGADVGSAIRGAAGDIDLSYILWGNSQQVQLAGVGRRLRTLTYTKPAGT